jgi:hypothetical protein
MEECSKMNNSDTTEPASGSPVGAAEHRFDALIEGWWADHFPGSAVARDTAAWNVAYAAKEALKRRLLRAEGQALPPTGMRTKIC